MNKSFLRGFKKEKKRFIPPMKQLLKMREYSYVDDLLPELIWLGLINDDHGYRCGSLVLETIVKSKIFDDSKFIGKSIALQGSYSIFDDREKKILIDALKSENLLEIVQGSLEPLTCLYEGFSLSFIGVKSVILSSADLVEKIKVCVGRHLDKRETPSIVLHGSLMLARMLAGTIRISSHIKLPDLNSVIENPGSEEAKHAAAFIRANAMAEMAALNIDKAWAQHFWNKGAELSECEFPDWVSDHE